MTQLTVHTITRSGTNVTLVAAGTTTAGNTFVNDGRIFLNVRNTNTTSSRTVTIKSRVTNPPPGTVVADLQVVVNANANLFIGPFPTQSFNDSQSRVQINYSNSGADLQVGVFRLG